MATTKADLIDALVNRADGLTKKEAAEIVETIFETMKECLQEGADLKISGFGNFEVRDKKPRPGRNPQTGEPITIEARRVLTFKTSSVLRKKLNEPR